MKVSTALKGAALVGCAIGGGIANARLFTELTGDDLEDLNYVEIGSAFVFSWGLSSAAAFVAYSNLAEFIDTCAKIASAMPKA